jgi:hypothetical protein
MRLSIEQAKLERLMNYVVEKSVPKMSYSEVSALIKDVQRDVKPIEEPKADA